LRGELSQLQHDQEKLCVHANQQVQSSHFLGCVSEDDEVQRTAEVEDKDHKLEAHPVNDLVLRVSQVGEGFKRLHLVNGAEILVIEFDFVVLRPVKGACKVVGDIAGSEVEEAVTNRELLLLINV
jgi:hypothetical protein